MIVYPAIDLRGGKVVRLREGDPNQQTVFSDDPVATAKAWIDQGAAWIHMVNLDGAFDTANENARILERVARLKVKVQFAGGLRDMAALGSALDAGAARLAIGTMAVRNPKSVTESLDRYGSEAICIALDAKDGKIATHGWTELSRLSPIDFAQWLRKQCVVHALYTDISRDGMLTGVNLRDTVALAKASGLRVIASGGVSSLSEIEALAESNEVAGVVVGMALYVNRFTLVDALRVAEGG